MKKYFIIPVMLLMAALVMTSCNESAYINAPGDNSKNYDTIPITIPDTNGVEITIAEALEICKGLKNDQVTTEVYKIRGVYVSDSQTPDIPLYTTISIMVQDPQTQAQIDCHYTNNINNRPFYKMESVPAKGSKMAVQGPLSVYKGTPQMQNGFIVKIDE